MSQDAAGFSDGRQPLWWQVWAPLLARAAAIGLALLGLAGIGLAAAPSESAPALSAGPALMGLARLLGAGPAVSLGSSPPERRPSALDAGVELAPGARATALEPPAPTPREPPPCVPAPPPAAGESDRARAGPAPPVAGASPSTVLDGEPLGPGSSGLTADGRVILNRASAAELRRLPGIGAKRAAAIVELRQRLGGRFRRPSDLLRIKGIGRRSLERMLPRLVLDE